MAFRLVWTGEAEADYDRLRDAATRSLQARQASKKSKATKAEGLFKQVHDCIHKLANNPRHPGLHTHKFDSLEHPWRKGDAVFEAYAQNATASAHRVFWCYGPEKGELTIVAITPHP